MSSPRSIVIAPKHGSLHVLLRQFPDDAYYVSKDAALEAYGSEGLFNVVDFASGWKVDFIIRKSRPFSVEEFARRQQANIQGTEIVVASPEDVVIAKNGRSSPSPNGSCETSPES